MLERVCGPFGSLLERGWITKPRGKRECSNQTSSTLVTVLGIIMLALLEASEMLDNLEKNKSLN